MIGKAVVGLVVGALVGGGYALLMKQMNAG